MEISIVSESELETYVTPERKVKVRHIIYEAEGFAPRSIWIDSEKLPDVVWQAKNPGKPVPAEVQARGDSVRRASAEADIAKIKLAPKARKI